MKEFLTVLEVSQKQKYIFQTNRLAENIGASIIIREVTEELPIQFISPEEYVFSGGGKSVYAFSSEEAAKRFVSSVSRAAMEQYPGIELYMATIGYDNEKESIIDAINNLYGRLESKKAARSVSFTLYGLGINESCTSTQLPASGRNRYGQLVSEECQAKYKAAEEKQDLIFSELLQDIPGYRFAHEFEELGGTKDTKNYIAITVMDGNKMGLKLDKFRSDFTNENPEVNADFNRRYKSEIRRVSKEIDDSYKAAVQTVINHLAQSLDSLIKRGVLTGFRRGGKVLPFRPLILAGDDICFVSDARIGTAFACEVLKEIETKKIEGLPMRACAGVAMVKTSYPFFRAHELAEELCQSAKGNLPSDDSKDASVIDFHIVQGEISGTLSDIRQQKYSNNTMTSKPYYLHDSDGEISMDMFRNRLKYLKQEKISRGNLKEYRTALREGENAAKRFLMHKRLGKIIENSFKNGRCVDFDVIEMLDIYHELEESK